MSNSEEETNTIPASLLLDFFRRSTWKLERYARNEVASWKEMSGPASLEELRKRLIEVQIEALHNVVDDHNSSAGEGHDATSPITVESVQAALREVGQSTNEGGTLYQPMQEMNDAARFAFARSVLCEYGAYLNPGIDEKSSFGEEGRINRSEILEFFGLVTVTVKMDEVQRYLQLGSPLTFWSAEAASAGCLLASPQPQVAETTPEHRLALLQSVILRAILGRPVTDTLIVLKEASRLLTDGSDAQVIDEELSQTFETYVSVTRTALANAATVSNFSDRHQGGVTRVVSVTYSEKTVGATGLEAGAPSQSFMEQQKESKQRKELNASRRAAEMQQALLAQLLMMDEVERAYVLREARDAHNNFLQQVRAIPLGPERTLFLQSIDEEQQRMLLMYKLWESMLADNGGEPPTIHRSA